MFPNSLILAAAPQPLLDSPAIETFKSWVNFLSQPQISLPCFFLVVFILMLVAYRWWTRPKIALPLFIGFCVIYFGSMAIDTNYALILEKPDNVPITLMLLGAMICLWMTFRQAALNDARIAAGQPLLEGDKDDKVLVWPDLVYIEFICLIFASAALVVWSILLRAPLESPANPGGPPNPSKAPWYFLGLQEMLVYYDPWMAGVLLPGLIIVGLIALPFLDTNPKGNGYFTLKQRPFAITVWLFGFLILWVVLIVFGTFLRGPNWNFFGPYQFWDSHLTVPLTNVNLSDFVWVFGMGKPLPTNPFEREWAGLLFVLIWLVILPLGVLPKVLRGLRKQMGQPRFWIMAMLLMVMALLPLKMVLRWVFNLKYFVYLPEFNLNL